MFSSLRVRLWLSYILVVGVMVVLAGVAVLVFLIRNPYEIRQEVQRMRVSANLVEGILQRNTGTQVGQTERLETILDRTDTALKARIVLLNSQGQTLVDSRVGSERPIPAVIANKDRRPAQMFRDSAGKEWIYVVRQQPDGTYLVVGTLRPQTQVMAVFRDEFIAPIIRAGLIAAVLALLLALLIARWVSAPLQRIADAARSISAGNYNQIPLEGPSEVKTVATAFNEMTERVRSSQQSQRDFVANVSHELKTPLTSIQGFAQAILDGTVETPEALNQAAQVIFSEASRMHRLVLDLLDLAKLDSGIAKFEFSPCDLSAVLKGVAEKFAPLASQAQVNLRVEIGDLPKVQADADRLAQVFTNLVDNALKFTPVGGEVLVSARTEDNWIEISVADSGPGIPPEDFPRIFERFYQTDKSRQGGTKRGVGLGLTIAREIVQAHGGTIAAYNKSDWRSINPTDGGTTSSRQGSVFMVKLPLAGYASRLNHRAVLQ